MAHCKTVALRYAIDIYCVVYVFYNISYLYIIGCRQIYYISFPYYNTYITPAFVSLPCTYCIYICGGHVCVHWFYIGCRDTCINPLKWFDFMIVGGPKSWECGISLAYILSIWTYPAISIISANEGRRYICMFSLVTCCDKNVKKDFAWRCVISLNKWKMKIGQWANSWKPQN